MLTRPRDRGGRPTCEGWPSPSFAFWAEHEGIDYVAKVTARIGVRGIDLKEMMASALDQLSELSAETWTITEVELYGSEDIASKSGMAQLWSASMTAEANV